MDLSCCSKAVGGVGLDNSMHRLAESLPVVKNDQQGCGMKSFASWLQPLVPDLMGGRVNVQDKGDHSFG